MHTIKNLGQLRATENLCVQLPSPHFQRQDNFLASLFSLVHSHHLPRPTITDSFTALLPVADNVWNPRILRLLILVQLAAMRTTVSRALAQKRARNKRYLDKKVRSLPASKAGGIIYVNRRPLTMYAADGQLSSLFKKLMPRTTGPFKVLEVRYQVLTFDENGIANIIPIDTATSIVWQSRQRLLERKKHRFQTTTLQENR